MRELSDLNKNEVEVKFTYQVWQDLMTPQNLNYLLKHGNLSKHIHNVSERTHDDFCLHNFMLLLNRKMGKCLKLN